MRLALALILSTAFLGACGSEATEAPATAAAPMAAAAPPSTNSTDLTGKVLEQLAAPPYVYLRIQTTGGEVWAAVVGDQVADGSEVTVYSPMLMSNFESKSLQRTFPEVYFGSLTAAPTAPAAMAAPATGTNPHAAAASTSIEVGVVDKAEGADARTIAEAWAQKAELADKTITVRGKVVKYNPGVMGKNWMHLQDGSGDPANGSNDLTVTTMDEVTKGDIVTITGTMHIDKDFGAGYSYAIIVEDAKVNKPL
jgi:hypothetical protein